MGCMVSFQEILCMTSDRIWIVYALLFKRVLMCYNALRDIRKDNIRTHRQAVYLPSLS